MMNSSLSQSISIRRAVPDDCFLLSRLGQEAYRQHFTYLWTPEGLEKFFELYYSAEAFQAVLQHENAIIWIAETEEQAVGYLMYFRYSCLPGGKVEGGYINRIYLLENCLGKGVGTQLMACAFKQARADNRFYIWLESMKSSKASIQFYKKQGFKIFGATAFTEIPMRNQELAQMWLLKKVLIG